MNIFFSEFETCDINGSHNDKNGSKGSSPNCDEKTQNCNETNVSIDENQDEEMSSINELNETPFKSTTDEGVEEGIISCQSKDFPLSPRPLSELPDLRKGRSKFLFVHKIIFDHTLLEILLKSFK